MKAEVNINVCGAVGTGKVTLIIAIIETLKEKGFDIEYVPQFEGEHDMKDMKMLLENDKRCEFLKDKINIKIKDSFPPYKRI